MATQIIAPGSATASASHPASQPQIPPAPTGVTAVAGLAGLGGVVPVLVSGPDWAAVAAQAAALADWWESHPAAEPAAVGWSSVARDQSDHRAVVVGRGREALLAGLTALAAGHHTAPDGAPYQLVTGTAGPAARIAFVFPGQGGQWAGMGRQLWAASPGFRSVIERCDRVVRELTDWSLADVVLGADGAASLERVDVVQPVLYAVMAGLAAVWGECGVAPDAVIGHSQGEVAAVAAAGGLTVEEGCRVAIVRSRAVVGLAGLGLMASVGLGADETQALLVPWDGRVVVAAPNSPRLTVVSGEAEAVLQLVDECDRRGVWCRLIHVDYASHSASVDALRDGIVTALEDLSGTPSRARLWSTVTGGWVATEALGAVHWFENLRRPVWFEPGVRGLAGEGVDVFVEVSPHPVLVQAIDETLAAAGHAATITGTLGRDRDEVASFLTALGRLAVSGRPVDWAGVFGPGGRPALDLPDGRAAPVTAAEPRTTPEADAGAAIDELSDDDLIALAFAGGAVTGGPR